VLAIRIMEVADDTQTTFIKGRYIMDGFLSCMRCCMYLYRRKKQEGIILNSNFRKAYDKVSL
jgi:hypothetical protein